MRALRINPNNQTLWLSYLKFECKFIKIVEKRQNILEGEEDKDIEALGNDVLEEGFVGFEDDDDGSLKFLMVR